MPQPQKKLPRDLETMPSSIRRLVESGQSIEPRTATLIQSYCTKKNGGRLGKHSTAGYVESKCAKTHDGHSGVHVSRGEKNEFFRKCQSEEFQTPNPR
ncbi:hypothetical protein RCL1_003013 [Eukaryota sp. TZLM3-RCL]